jgi:formylglycine-generating enzyme required for sulfatase activity
VGVFDLAGNVSEWVQDCWHGSYTRAPTDGSAWENAGCARRVVRGAYWASAPEQARSSARVSAPQGLHSPQLGFRVVREL